MAVLIDTNILLRSVQTHHPHYAQAEHALATLRTTSEPLLVTVQNLVEFWAVATRPVESNGLGMTTEDAARELARIKGLFRLLTEPPSLSEEWEWLVITCKVSGKHTHDARLAATMRLHGIARVLTFNGADFRRFPGVTVLDPADFGR
jgi:predicted nucleic acid-binding protein